MEVLQPETKQTDIPERFSPQSDILEEGIDLKSIQFLNYLGLKDEIFNSKVMEKVRFLADNLSMDELMHIDFKVGQDPNMPRIDRIFSYMKLEMLGRERQKELDMINSAKSKWEMQQPSQI